MDLNKQWICEACGVMLGPIVTDDTKCLCDDIYCICWSRIEDAQAEMDKNEKESAIAADRCEKEFNAGGECTACEFYQDCLNRR